jgi:hypothetical protein
VGLLETSSSVTRETYPEADGVPRYGSTAPTAGEAGPGRREGASVTITHSPCLGEEDHDPCSPPPQTIAGEEEDLYSSAQLVRSGCAGGEGENQEKLTGLFASVLLRADPRS